MSFWEFRRGIASVRLLLEFGSDHGVDATTLLKGTQITPDLLDNPSAEILASQELRAVDNLLRQLGPSPGLGLELGARYRLATFGLWGYGLMSSANFDAAINMALRFVPLTFAYTVIGFQRAGDEALLTFVEPDFEPPVRRFLVERDMAAAAELFRQLAGESFRLLRFELKRQQGRLRVRGRPLKPVLGAAVGTDGEADRLGFPAHYLDRSPPHADPNTVAMCEQMCTQLMEQRRARLGTAKLIEHYLDSQGHAELPSLAGFARLLGMSERTLKRRLHEEGTSFREVAMKGLARRAAELVARGEPSVSVVAERLGYADLSTFSQAFKRWHGVSPLAYRQAALDATVRKA